MATRTSIRPRPVDILRQLNIVRDVAELDKTDDLDATQTPAPAAAFEQPPAGPQKKKKEVKEIPVPEVRLVPGYTREYLPLFRIPDTYIRGKGGVGWVREDYCEYDLDNDDEDWLEVFNAGSANRLSEEKFEQMLWRLETANAEANQRVMSEAGSGTQDWRMLPAAVAATSNMSRDEALSVLRKYACARDPILHAVYDYWRGKRERLNRPIMRRLQAPTNPSDTNPYNVFRPRERVNRPQTRRRRENTQDCLDKMRQIRESMLKSLEMTELLTFREARKRDIHRLEVDMQRYQVARHHQPRHQLEVIEAEGAAQLQETLTRSRLGEGRLRAYLDSAGASISYDSPLRRALMRKRRRQEMEGCANGEAIARLPPPPLPADDEMLVLFTPDFTRLLRQPQQQQAQQQHASGLSGGAAEATEAEAQGSPAANGGGGGKPPLVMLPPGLDLRCTRARVSRCGRMMLTRCDPLTMRPYSPQHQPPPGTVDLAIPDGLAMRHPLLHSAQLPSAPWAAALDLDLLPEGIADKAALRVQRDRRLSADRLNAAMLRQTQQTLHQQAAGGMIGAASVAGAAAAAAAVAGWSCCWSCNNGRPTAKATAATSCAQPGCPCWYVAARPAGCAEWHVATRAVVGSCPAVGCCCGGAAAATSSGGSSGVAGRCIQLWRSCAAGLGAAAGTRQRGRAGAQGAKGGGCCGGSRGGGGCDAIWRGCSSCRCRRDAVAATGGRVASLEAGGGRRCGIRKCPGRNGSTAGRHGPGCTANVADRRHIRGGNRGGTFLARCWRWNRTPAGLYAPSGCGRCGTRRWDGGGRQQHRRRRGRHRAHTAIRRRRHASSRRRRGWWLPGDGSKYQEAAVR